MAPGAKVGDPLQLTVTPATCYARIVNKTRTVPSDSAASIDENDSVSTDGSVTVTVTGGLPLGKAGILYAYPVPSPSRFAQTVLTDALIAAGVAVAPSRVSATPVFTKLATSYSAANMVAEHQSAPATEMESTSRRMGRRSGSPARTALPEPALARPAWTSACAVLTPQASTHASAARILCPVMDRVSAKRGTGREFPVRFASAPASSPAQLFA